MKPEDGLESGHFSTLEQGCNPVETETQIWTGEHQLPTSSSQRYKAKTSWALELLKDPLRSTIFSKLFRFQACKCGHEGDEQNHHEGKTRNFPTATNGRTVEAAT